MKKLTIKYNPYKIETQVLIGGRLPAPNSRLHFEKMRLQEWADKMPEILVDECNDREFEIEFKGTRADYDDLMQALNSQRSIRVKSWKRDDSILDISQVEDEIDRIFLEIQKGDVASLKDAAIVKLFKQAKNQEFEINVVATVSSGKSTLINAMLGKKVMPQGNLATTATIVRIITADHDNFRAEAYNSAGKKLRTSDDISYKEMKQWNSDAEISAIDIYGRIPCVASVGMKLVLVDTPGPNNARDEKHRELTYSMLDNSEKSLVLFILNGEHLDVNDERTLLDYVCGCMKKGGKQSRERFIFVVNKMDAVDLEDDDIRGTLETARKGLEERGIKYPNIYPTAAQVALECRAETKLPVIRDGFKARLQMSDDMKFDTYYDFNNLPQSSKARIQNYLAEADETGKLEIHSGVVSVEEAISMYVNKYARALKVKNLVDSFNNRLRECAAIETVKEAIRNNESKKKELGDKIARLNSMLKEGNEAKVCADIIDRKDLRKMVDADIHAFIADLRKKIDRTVFAYKNDSKVQKARARQMLANLQKEKNEILAQLNAKVDYILEKSYNTLFEDIMQAYRKHLEVLDMKIDGSSLGIKTLHFVAEDLADLNRVFKDQTETVDEGEYVTKTVRKSREVKKINWFWTPWNWFKNRKRTEYYQAEEQEWVPNNVEYVNMATVASSYFQPLQAQLVDAQKSASEHAETQGEHIKSELKKQLAELNKKLFAKTNELGGAIHFEKQTAAEIEKQRRQLKWMEGIIARVDKLINF